MHESANSMCLHLRHTHGDYWKVRSLNYSMTSSNPKSRPTTQPADYEAQSNKRVAGRILMGEWMEACQKK